jgi:hypothetical protein
LDYDTLGMAGQTRIWQAHKEFFLDAKLSFFRLKCLTPSCLAC